MLQIQSYSSNASQIREETLEGKDYLVYPVVAVQEQVLNGELLPAEEIELFVEAWNGVPVTIHHPRNAYGAPLSANTPEALEQYSVGRLFNARYEDKKLKAEVWIETAKVHQLGEDAEEAIRQIRQGGCEVSTAYLSQVEPKSGTFNGEHYEGIQHNLRPDHLALLPTEIGACSLQDGCGVPRINTSEMEETVTANTFKEAVSGVFDTAFTLGQNFAGWTTNTTGPALEVEKEVKVNVVLDTSVEHKKENEQMITNGAKLSKLLQKMVSDSSSKSRNEKAIVKQMASSAGIDTAKVHSILNGEVDFLPRRWMEAFSEVLNVDPFDVMMAALEDAKDYMENGEDNGDGQNEEEEQYNSSEEEIVTENSEEVENTEDSVATSEEKSENKSVDEISENVKEENNMTKCELVSSIINNEHTQFAEEDREWLGSLEENQLEKLIPSVPETEEETTEVVENEEVVETEEPETTPLTAEEYIARIEDPEVRELLSSGLKQQRDETAKLIKAITANSKFTKDELAGKSMTELRKLKDLIPEPDYSGAGGPVTNTGVGDDQWTVPAPPPCVLATNTEDK